MSLPRVLRFSSLVVGLLAGSVMPVLAADGVPGAKPLSPNDEIQLFTQTVPNGNFVVAPSELTLKVESRLKLPSTVCYALREYKFARTPDTNALKPSGASTCENAAQFQVKNAVSAPVR